MSIALKDLSLLLFLLFMGCHGLHAEEKAFEELDEIFQGYTNQKLADFMEKRLSRASEIVMQHIPNSLIGHRLSKKKDILTVWRYQIILNCTLDCGGRHSSLLKEMALHSYREANECPARMNTVIRLMKGKRSVLDIFFHQSGHCFTIGKQSYFTNRKFKPLEDFFRF